MLLLATQKWIGLLCFMIIIFFKDAKRLIIWNKIKSDNGNVVISKTILKDFFAIKMFLYFSKNISRIYETETIGNWGNKKQTYSKLKWGKFKKRTHQDLTPFLIGRDCLYALLVWDNQYEVSERYQIDSKLSRGCPRRIWISLIIIKSFRQT